MHPCHAPQSQWGLTLCAYHRPIAKASRTQSPIGKWNNIIFFFEQKGKMYLKEFISTVLCIFKIEPNWQVKI